MLFPLARQFAPMLIAIAFAAWLRSDDANAQVPSIGPSGCVALCGDDRSTGGSGGGVPPGDTRTDNKTLSRDLNQSGVAVGRRGDNAEAVGLYRNALQFWPGNMTAQRNLGFALNQLAFNNVNRARPGRLVELLQEATIFRPNDATVRGNYDEYRRRHPSMTNGRGPCGQCDKALFGDLSHGLSASASFKSYARQSRAKFQNCGRKTFSQCKASCGSTYLKSLDTCLKHYGEGAPVKSCVHRSLQGLRHYCR